MTFTSLTFILFCPLVFALYWALRTPRRQNLLLITASYLFYGWWDYRFCSLMLISSLFDFGVGCAMGRTDQPAWRRIWLGVSLVGNLGLLGFFKYFNFFAASAQALAGSLSWQLNPGTLEIILPVGISFYTFQSLGYTIDVYRRTLTPTRSLVDYLAFISFFPQLVAGPIERATHLLPQIAQPRTFDYAQAVEGCRQILWGFFKKMVIADRLAAVVNSYYAQPDAFTGPELALATVCFAFQIYCDFSAYSDIAIGTARLFGVELMRNFAYPYFSQSVAEFWRRWHISLSTWFRDYVYLPLGGSHVPPVRRTLNTLATFLISGLWHGAAWTFVAWGGINGLSTIASKSAGDRRIGTNSDTPGGEGSLPHPLALLRMLTTFAIICSCWVFFRAQSLHDAFWILRRIASDTLSAAAYSPLVARFSADRELRVTLIVLLAFIAVEWLQRRRPHALQLPHWRPAVRWGLYSLMFWGTLCLMPKNGGQDFIYFDF